MSTGMTWQTFSIGSEGTEKLGEFLGELLKGGDVVELVADLGGGKTTFIRGIAKGLGSNDTVSSPTFTLSNIYKCKRDLEMHHFDFYRLSKPGIITDQLAESLENPNVITAVEWGKIINEELPKNRFTIELSPSAYNSDERHISFKYSEPQANIIKKIETQWTNLQP